MPCAAFGVSERRLRAQGQVARVGLSLLSFLLALSLTMASLNTELFRPPSFAATSAPSPSLILSVVLGLALALLTWCWPRKAGNLPPGPKPGFFVGNREQVPKEGKPWKWFRDLNLQYGECGIRCGERRPS